MDKEEKGVGCSVNPNKKKMGFYLFMASVQIDKHLHVQKARNTLKIQEERIPARIKKFHYLATYPLTSMALEIECRE